MDDVQCTSSASQLLECYSRPILTHNCLHSADAGVRCEGKLYNWFPNFVDIYFYLPFIYSSLQNWSAATGRR